MKEYISFLEYQKKLKNILSLHLFERQNYEEYLLETPEYQEYMAVYQEVLKDFKSFIQNYNIHSSLELGILYTCFLLPKGILSITNQFQYKYLKGIFEPLEILGAKVISGRGCCRHISKNLVDILNTCGYEAYYLKTEKIDLSELHALVGIIYDNKKLTLDPTNKKIGYFIDQENIQTQGFLNTNKKYLYHCCYYNGISNLLNEQFMNDYNVDDFYHRNSLEEIKELFNIYSDISILYYQNELDFLKFKKEQICNYQKIYKNMNQFFSYRKCD